MPVVCLNLKKKIRDVAQCAVLAYHAESSGFKPQHQIKQTWRQKKKL